MAFSQTNDGVIKSYGLRFLLMWLLLNDDIETHNINVLDLLTRCYEHIRCVTQHTHTHLKNERKMKKKKRNQQENNDGEKTTAAATTRKKNQPKQKLYMIHTSTNTHTPLDTCLDIALRRNAPITSWKRSYINISEWLSNIL